MGIRTRDYLSALCRCNRTVVLLALALTLLLASTGRATTLVDEYLERHFETFPTAATAAGRHDLDHRLEDFGEAERRAWLEYNQAAALRIRDRLTEPDLPFGDRLDLELVLREAEWQIFRLETLRTPERDPLFWSGLLSNSTVFLLVRDDLPLEERLASAVARVDQFPRLVGQARQALDGTEASMIAAELCAMAAGQVRSAAKFYREGFPLAGEGSSLELELARSGSIAADSLSQLAEFLDALQKRALGTFRLGDHYSESFRRVTGIHESVSGVLARAEEALEKKVDETARFGRKVWPEIFADRPTPESNRELILALFDRVSQDRARTTDEFVEDYRTLVEQSVEFVREKEIMTLPEPLTLHLGKSPAFFIGQSVGGVYPAGPYAAADSKTLLFLPMPSEAATPGQRDAFFRDFNHHFNVMITPHELIPGHYLQLKLAAQHPRKVRALFGDGVYIEGWGTFAERLMLDLGWGGPLDRLAHLKKQLENIARTIVDIRVHTQGATREEVLEYVQREAMQDEQFAGNMWRRAMTSSPQLTFYFLGYSEVWGLYEDVREARGLEFDLRVFMDGMMEMGPVPVARYRERFLDQPD